MSEFAEGFLILLIPAIVFSLAWVIANRNKKDLWN